jgi:transcriptional regulator with PAS, ATPase and Fis domain
MSVKYQDELIDRQTEKIVEKKMIYRSHAMRELIEKAIKVSKSNASVLITGPSGSGKEKIAELIHQRSNRFKKPMIRVNCGAIPENIFESEMFGYEYGAFTGARKEGKAGLVELAHQGTLFLDEIAEMPVSLQVKLLRFLDNGLVFRVGATKGRTSDIRILSATNQDVEALVREKKFREDLFYRLQVIPIHVPPLNARREDIPALIEHFVSQLNKETGQMKKLSPQAIDCLVEYDYPGNVRELINICERLVVMTSGGVITTDHLPQNIKSSKASTPFSAEQRSAEELLNGEIPLKNIVENYEKEILINAAKVHRNQKEMAKTLGVNESTITRKFKKHNLSMKSMLQIK